MFLSVDQQEGGQQGHRDRIVSLQVSAVQALAIYNAPLYDRLCEFDQEARVVILQFTLGVFKHQLRYMAIIFAVKDAPIFL